MKLRISDPLALLPYQTGVIFRSTSGSKVKDDPGTWLNTQQRSVELGTPVPIVFGLFVDNVGTDDDYGGVFVSPPATKIRYDLNTTTNEVTTKLTMVLSEGYVPKPQVRDVYQRTCRRGTLVWAYNKLAGPYFTAGNYTSGGGSVTIIFPSYAGSDAGTYEDMTTLYYTNQFAANDDTWQNQVHVFVRQGMHVTRLAGGGVGPSNNMVDLAYYLIQKTSRVPSLLIDTTAMSVAAWFTEVNGFTWDGILDEPANLEDWMREMAGFFLLRVSEKNGKKGFRPLLPITLATYQIATGSVSWKFGFTEEHLVPDGFQIEYIPLSERKPICAQMMWRQQPPNDIGFVRSTEVRIDGEALEGPYEQYDMTQFCTREDHAVKVGAYQVARRKYVTHSLRIRVKPDSYNTLLVLGDIVRVQLRRENEPGVVSFHDFLYEIEKINKTQTGVVEFDLMHFPIDSLGRSILALYVAGAEGTGYMYDLGRNEYSCDDPDNVDDDTPVDPTDPGDGNNPDTPDTDVDLPQPGTDVNNPPNDAPVFTPGSEIGGGPGGTTGIAPSGGATDNNPDDPFDTDQPGGGATITDGGGTPWASDRQVFPGDTINVETPCSFADMKAYWYNRLTGSKGFLNEGNIIFDPNTPLKWVVSITEPLNIDPFEADNWDLRVTYCCPDPSLTEGFAECQLQTVGPAGPVNVGQGSGSLRIINGGNSFDFSVLGAIAGFSVFWYPDDCGICQAKASVSWFDTDGNFQVQHDMFEQGCVASQDGFVGNLYKLEGSEYVYQYALYATFPCDPDDTGGTLVVRYPAVEGASYYTINGFRGGLVGDPNSYVGSVISKDPPYGFLAVSGTYTCPTDWLKPHVAVNSTSTPPPDPNVYTTGTDSRWSCVAPNNFDQIAIYFKVYAYVDGEQITVDPIS